MKKQQLEHLTKHKKNLNTIISLILSGIIVLLISSCQKDNIEKVKILSEEKRFPDQSLNESEIIYSKNGLMELRVQAPVIDHYQNSKSSQIEFPEGMLAEFYDTTLTVESQISANYAVYHESSQIWEAKNNVVTINNQGDTLNTEYLLWNQNESIIYTDRYVKITTKDGVIHGKGFESNQNFTNWKIKETTGSLTIDEEDDTP
ncbi:MAG: LPS export ABC transporter periplasmic protein LptC [Bacteroidales bacterium]